MKANNRLPDKVEALLERYKSTPLDAYEQVKHDLKDNCKSGGRFDPLMLDNDWKEGRDGYHAAHNWFKKNGLYYASEKLLLDWWNYLGLIQLKTPIKHIYRAEAAFLLTDLYWTMGEKGIALRWAMYMQVDDILHEHISGGGAGKQTLTTKLGMSSSAFNQLNEIAQKCLRETNKSSDWSHPSGFAEEIICRFARSNMGFSLAVAGSEREMPVSQGYYQSLLNLMGKAKSNSAKGKALENIAFYLVLLLPGCIPRKNVLAERRLFETDILVQNLNPTPNVLTDMLGRQFIIECKNQQRGANVSQIGYCLYRMKLTHTRFGIIFSKSGITGRESGEAGQGLV